MLRVSAPVFNHAARCVILLSAGVFLLGGFLAFAHNPVGVFSFLLCLTGLFFAWLSVQFLPLLKVHGGTLFMGALLLRLVLILLTRPSNDLVDISINGDMGALVARGINPYDPTDNPDERQRLRLDAVGFAEYTSQSQEMWDYHAGSQLPLYTFLMGWIETVWPHPYFHRIVYAFFDSLLCLLLYVFVSDVWPVNPVSSRAGTWLHRYLTYFSIAVFLGMLSPLLLRSGTLIPSSKSLMTLLVLSGIYFSFQAARSAAAWKSGLLLGASIAYMALGVFALPIFLSNLYASAKATNRSLLPVWMAGLAATAVGTAVWVAPFALDLLTMVKSRTDFGSTNAIHASMWRFLAEWTPAWRPMQRIAVGISVLMVLIGILRRRLDLSLLTGLLYLGFLSLWMIDGSMDRINIAVVLFITLLGVKHARAARNFTWVTFFGGIIMLIWAVGLWVYRKLTDAPYIPFEVLDSVFNFLFFGIAFGYVCWLTYRSPVPESVPNDNEFDRFRTQRVDDA